MRHPVMVFLASLALLSMLLELVWANVAGGWRSWGGGILWYRAACWADDIFLAAGAYLCARSWAGPRWWKGRSYHVWMFFLLTCLAGALFLRHLNLNLAKLFDPTAPPPFATGWLSVWQRTWLPFFVLVWVRRRSRAWLPPPSP